jgi:hypothetical protein
MKISNFLIGGAMLLISSCSSGEKTVSAPASTAADGNSMVKGHGGRGGQVVESGKYHLEIVPEKSANETHLDFYIEKGEDHQTVADAKVSGEIQPPDGQSKPITFTYDPEGKHYAGIVPGKAAGAYQLKVTAAIGSDKADGRFSFDR